MLSGSAMVRVAALLVSAGLIAGLVQFLWPRASQPPAGTAQEAPVSREPVRTIPTAKTPAEPAAPVPSAPSFPPPAAPAPASPPPLAQTPPPPPAQSPNIAPAPAPAPAPAVPDPGQRALEDAGPRAVALVDLNTATLAQLNALRGGGNIGRAIIQRRPYAAVDQLLSKRVLSRATYDRIKDQVSVQ